MQFRTTRWCIEDDANKKPEFHADEDDNDSALVSEYRAEVMENETVPFELMPVMSAIDDEVVDGSQPRPMLTALTTTIP